MFRHMLVAAPTPVCRFAVPQAALRVSPFHAVSPFHGMLPRLFDVPRAYEREPISVTEEADRVHFELELPRFRPEDVKFTVDKERGVVGIKGQRRDAGGAVQAEFERGFHVSPRWLDLAGCETKVELGVATLTIPKKSARGTTAPQSASKQPTPSSSTEPAPTVAAAASDATTPTPAGADGTSAAAQAPAATEPAAEVTATTDATGAAAAKVAMTRLDADGYRAVRAMRWPPQFATEESESEVVHSCEVPAALKPDSVDVTLERGYLNVGIQATLDSVEKDADGRVVFQKTRSVQYTTALQVPRGTATKDVRVQLKEGKLRIAVAKRGEEGIKVTAE